MKDSAPWMETALKEIGQAEVAGKRANPRILQYFKSSKFWGRDDTGGANAWCASFVAWVMQENGYMPVAKSFRARAWVQFGKKIPKPVYGAIGVKSRRGGGHVAFVVGQSEDENHLFMLGGNQDDKVQVTRYPRKAWMSFHVPSDYDASESTLPVYTRPARAAGKEE